MNAFMIRFGLDIDPRRHDIREVRSSGRKTRLRIDAERFDVAGFDTIRK